MEAVSQPVSMGESRVWQAILTGGLFAGALDLTAACAQSYLQRGASPLRVFQAIASGLLGAESYQGGASTAALGVFLHFVIAFGATTVFYLASRKITFLVSQAILSGALFGVAVYWFMQLIVVPLSAFPHKNQFAFDQIVIGMLIHIFCVGLPIALAIRHFSK